MSRPTFLGGVGFAVAVALAGGIGFTLLAPWLGGAALRAVVAAAGFAYLAWLLACRRPAAGRVVAVVAWAGISAASAWFAPSFALYLAAQVGFLWLVRALLFHRGALAALADLGLSVLAVAAAGWALAQTGSVGAALWCFFLVAAAFVAIPPRWPRREAAAPRDIDDRFQQAHRAAESAVAALTARR